jgi:triacylglycerol esterase/lipase EstA (alpha/beta hydrolase family)
VVLNFTDATDYVQKNAFVVAELIQQVQALIAPQTTVALVGASMGGLCSRYALAYMESHAIPHRVRTWIAFDAPHAGADIPLGIQYWVDFFASQSTDAAALRDALNRPAARQMLVYHYTIPPGATGQADPLRATMLTDFTAVGDYPAQPRTVAIVDGSGSGQNQGFLPGDQIVQWVYTSALVDITGNV